MPGPNSSPNGTIRPKASITKRSLKVKARKMRVRRERLDPETGRLIPSKQ